MLTRDLAAFPPDGQPLVDGADGAVLSLNRFAPVLAAGGGALHAFVAQFFGEAHAPFEQVVFARVDALSHAVAQQHAQMDVRVRRLFRIVGFVVQTEGVAVAVELLGGKLAGGVEHGLRRRAGRHGEDDVEGFAVFGFFGNAQGVAPVVEMVFDGLFAVELFAVLRFQFHFTVAGNVVEVVADALHAFGVAAVAFGDFDHHFGMLVRGRAQIGEGGACFQGAPAAGKRVPPPLYGKSVV